MKEPVPSGLDGQRLDRVVSMMAGVSRAEAASLVESGAVAVNGSAVEVKSYRLAGGDVVDIDHMPAPPPESLVADPTVAVKILYQDDDLFVVDKEPGVVVHPGAGNATGTLVQGLLAIDPALAEVGDDPMRPGVVHRLDKDTSGVMVVARSQSAFDGLVHALAARDVERVYRALVWGRFETTSGLVDAPIGRSNREPTRMTVSSQGKPARTRYRVLETYPDPEVTLIECRLETGRTHQIRVHLSSIAHPVVGDDRYGGVRPSLVTPRVFLHARALAFTHPVSGEPIRVETPLPPDLERVLAGLRPS